MMDNIDLTEKQIEYLAEETKFFSANAANGSGYLPADPKSRNGFYYLIVKYFNISEGQINTFKRIAQRSRTQYLLSVNNNRLELRFYATFGELPKTLK